MITLATLFSHTKQQVFDHVAHHLLTQTARSVKPPAKPGDPDECVYRSPDGKTCAVGCLIADNEYIPMMEGASVRGVLGWLAGVSGVRWTGLTRPITIDRELHDSAHGAALLNMLVALQTMHDAHEPEEWPDALVTLARKYDVTFTPPQGATP